MMRVTYVAPGDALGLRNAQLVEMGDGGEDLYRTSIQMGELNALNACLALARYKQLRGFYVDAVDGPHLLFDVTDLRTVVIELFNDNTADNGEGRPDDGEAEAA